MIYILILAKNVEIKNELSFLISRDNIPKKIITIEPNNKVRYLA